MYKMNKPTRTYFALTMVCFALACEATGTPQGAILPAAAAPEVIDQCTRGVPIRVTGYWKPSRNDVERLEQILPSVVDSALATVVEPNARLRSEEYRRQYVGIVSESRMLIYINGFHRSWIRDRLPYWRRRAVSVCDGGLHFWGATYDVSAESVIDVQFNTRLVSPD